MRTNPTYYLTPNLSVRRLLLALRSGLQAVLPWTTDKFALDGCQMSLLVPSEDRDWHGVSIVACALQLRTGTVHDCWTGGIARCQDDSGPHSANTLIIGLSTECVLCTGLSPVGRQVLGSGHTDGH